jgi:hypothetical protein
MKPYYDEPMWTDPRWLWAAIAAVCVAALLGNLAVWLLLRDSDGGPSSTSAGVQGGQVQQSGSGSHPSNSIAPTQGPEVKSAVADCRSRWQQQSQPLRAAQSSMHQWRVHIKAMNELVAGNISLAQATTFWNNTRKGAMHRIMRFEQAESRYRTTAPACSANALQQADGTTIPVGARDCMRAAVAGDRVLAAAQTAITTWQHHVHDMEMLRKGNLSAAQATQMWQMNWHIGQRQLAEYTHASTHALYLRCA